MRHVLLAALALAGCKSKSSPPESHSSASSAGSAEAAYGSKRAAGANGASGANEGAGGTGGANAANGANDGAGGSNAAPLTGGHRLATGTADTGPATARAGWAATQMVASGKAHATSIAIDSKDNAVIAIQFEKTITVRGDSFDGGEGGVLLVKLPIGGGPIAWTKLLGKDNAVEYASVAIDSKDAVVLTATMRGTVELGGGSLTSAGDKDILLAKLKADGTHEWSRRFGGTQPDRPTNVAVDTKDNIAIAGYYADAADFGGKKLTGKNSAEMFVARYTPAGKIVFANRISGGGEQQSELYDVTVDAKSNVIAIGAFSDKLDIGGKPLAGIPGKALQTFVVAYTPAGGLAWSTAYSGGGMTMANVVRADKAGNVLLAGSDMNMPVDQNNMVSFDATSGAPTQGAMKSFIAELGPDRKRKWSLPIANQGMGDSVEHAIADSGEILVVGDAASAPFDDAALRDVKTFFARISAAGVLISVVAIPNATAITASPTSPPGEDPS